jgi:hypothetical protein
MIKRKEAGHDRASIKAEEDNDIVKRESLKVRTTEDRKRE